MRVHQVSAAAVLVLVLGLGAFVVMHPQLQATTALQDSGAIGWKPAGEYPNLFQGVVMVILASYVCGVLLAVIRALTPAAGTARLSACETFPRNPLLP